MNTGHITFRAKTDKIEITDVRDDGFKLSVEGREYSLLYSDFPELKEAGLKELSNITSDFSGNIHWPEIGFSIEKDLLSHPEDYPLKFKNWEI